jgi:hypothetical protein
MKNKMNANPAVQENTTADRNFIDQKDAQKQKGISNGGSQRSDQTSNRDNDRKQANKK